jgi:hypothetical protein
MRALHWAYRPRIERGGKIKGEELQWQNWQFGRPRSEQARYSHVLQTPQA